MSAIATNRVFDSVLADQAGLEARHPAVFKTNWGARAQVFATLAVAVGLVILSLWVLDIEWARVFRGLTRLGQFVSVMLPPSYGTLPKLGIYLHALAETVAIAFLGTALGAVLALPVGFLAARNVLPEPISHFCIRRGLDMIRSVHMLIWALIWITVVGLGPFAGLLAIAISEFGLLGKVFSEAIEANDNKASEGIVSTGGGPLHRIRFGLLPGVLPVLISQVLYQIESNTRTANILGIVGAGGIGAHFQEQIRLNEWQHVAFLTLMMLVTVAVIDFISTKARFAIIGAERVQTSH